MQKVILCCPHYEDAKKLRRQHSTTNESILGGHARMRKNMRRT